MVGMSKKGGDKKMHYKARSVYIGIDTHKYTHTAVIMNCWQEKLAEITFENKPSAYYLLVTEVKKHLKKSLKPIYGLEDVGGVGRALAVYLIKNEYTVKEVNSALSSEARKSRTIFHKSDSFDALCIAKALFSHLDQIQDTKIEDKYWSLAQISKRRDGMVKTITMLKTQLHTQLSHNYPSYYKFFSEVDGKTALAFWEEYPSVRLLKMATIPAIFELLFTMSHRFFTIKKAHEIYSLAMSDEPDISEDHMETREFLVKSLVKEIVFKEKEIEELEGLLEIQLASFDYKLRSMPGIDIVMSAKIISEVGDISRFPTAEKFACYSGISPITYSSGKSEKHYKSQQGNRALYQTFHLLAIHQTLENRNTKEPRNLAFHEYYHKKISQGKTKGQALVCVMRRLSNIVYAIMKNRSEYVAPKVALNVASSIVPKNAKGNNVVKKSIVKQSK